MVLPDEHGRRGAVPADGTAKASSVRASSWPRSSFAWKTQHRVSRTLSVNPLFKPFPATASPGRRRRSNAFCEPLVKPLSLPWSSPYPPPVKPLPTPCPAPGPRQEREKRCPSPRFAGPAPTASTENPDASGQYPAGPRSEDDPCLGLRRLRTGGDCSFFIIRHRCDKVNTLVGGSDGFFCHSVISRPAPAWETGRRGCRLPRFLLGWAGVESGASTRRRAGDKGGSGGADGRWAAGTYNARP